MDAVDSGEFGELSSVFWFEDKKDATTFKKNCYDYLVAYHCGWDNLDEMLGTPKFEAIKPDW